jgi:hypothetical protein
MTDRRFGWNDDEMEFAEPGAEPERETLRAVIAAVVTREQLAAAREQVRAVSDPDLRADLGEMLAMQADLLAPATDA